jgi:hypothetical protein
MMDDSVDNSALIAFLMEVTNASIEDVTKALENCGGNDQLALELLTSGGGNRTAGSSSAGTTKGAKSAKAVRSLVDEDAEIDAVKAPLRSDQGGSKRQNTGKNDVISFRWLQDLHH